MTRRNFLIALTYVVTVQHVLGQVMTRGGQAATTSTVASSSTEAASSGISGGYGNQRYGYVGGSINPISAAESAAYAGNVKSSGQYNTGSNYGYANGIANEAMATGYADSLAYGNGVAASNAEALASAGYGGNNFINGANVANAGAASYTNNFANGALVRNGMVNEVITEPVRVRYNGLSNNAYNANNFVNMPNVGLENYAINNGIISNNVPNVANSNSYLTIGMPNPSFPGAANLEGRQYGISVFGDNLLIDGTVAVNGNLPFNSVIDVYGTLPTAGSSYVQYKCGSEWE